MHYLSTEINSLGVLPPYRMVQLILLSLGKLKFSLLLHKHGVTLPLYMIVRDAAELRVFQLILVFRLKNFC